MKQVVTREKAEKFFTFFNLQHFTDELMEGYSHSMRQKLVIAGAFHNPKVAIVDQPLMGLDPKGARQGNNCFKIYAEMAQQFLCPLILKECPKPCVTESALPRKER